MRTQRLAGHNWNIAGFLTQPFHLPSERMTTIALIKSNLKVLGFVDLTRAITGIISSNNVWPDAPKLDDEPG